MKISVITPSVRLEGLEIVKNSLSKQTFTEFEWLVGSKQKPDYDCIWVEDDFKGGFWNLNRIYNKLIKQAQGELIVSLQDCIHIKPDGLEKFWNNYQNNRKAIVSGVGDQYERINKWGKPEIKIWSDPRKREDYGSFYECYPHDVEWNWCAVPKQALYDVGGFCEEMDFVGFGMDGYQVNERMDELGWKFYLDQSNESFTVRHDRSVYGGDDRWNQNNNLSNGKYTELKLKLINEGNWPKLHYLD